MSYDLTRAVVPGCATVAVERIASHLVAPGSTLLAVWAHPDDESFLGAGLMAAARRQGSRVVNVCATLGERGTDDPVRFPPRRPARIRRRELRRALRELDVPAPVLLDHADGACADVPDWRGAEQVAEVLDQVRPETVLSFGRDGVTGHEDHRAVARWTEQAVAGSRSGASLVTTAVGAAWPEDLLPAMHSVSMFYPGFPEPDLPPRSVVAKISGGLLDQKLAALAQHRSQTSPLLSALGPDGYRRMATVEAYHAANPEAAHRLQPLLAPADHARQTASTTVAA